MAENKKSFVLYTDQRSLFHTLTDQEAGKLIKHIYDYVSDMNPETDDRITQISFEPIKQQLKRDLEIWRKSIEGKSEGGKKSADMRKKLKDMQDEFKNFKILQDTSSNSTVNVNDNVTVNDNVDYDYYIVGGKIEKGNLVDWYLKNQQPIFESILMQNSLGKYKDRIILDLRVKFINGYSFNDYKHISNSIKKFIIENSKTFIPQTAKLVR